MYFWVGGVPNFQKDGGGGGLTGSQFSGGGWWERGRGLFSGELAVFT